MQRIDTGSPFERYILPDPGDWPACWPLTTAAFGAAPAAATMLSASLQTPAMRIQIEVTARLATGRS